MSLGKKLTYGSLTLLVMFSALFCGNTPVVKDDEEVIFFPTCAHLDKKAGIGSYLSMAGFLNPRRIR